MFQTPDSDTFVACASQHVCCCVVFDSPCSHGVRCPPPGGRGSLAAGVRNRSVMAGFRNACATSASSPCRSPGDMDGKAWRALSNPKCSHVHRFSNGCHRSTPRAAVWRVSCTTVRSESSHSAALCLAEDSPRTRRSSVTWRRSGQDARGLALISLKRRRSADAPCSRSDLSAARAEAQRALGPGAGAARAHPAQSEQVPARTHSLGLASSRGVLVSLGILRKLLLTVGQLPRQPRLNAYGGVRADFLRSLNLELHAIQLF